MDATQLTKHRHKPRRPIVPTRHPDEHDPHLHPVYRLAESCLYEVGHSHQVTRLSLLLFDQLHGLHRLNARRRYRLTCAALLHDIGWIEGRKRHHKTALRYIMESSMLPWDRRERLIVGSIARYHRRSRPKLKHDHYAELSRSDRKDVRVLSALLRVADGLDDTHRSNVRDVVCRVTEEQIVIGCRARRNAGAEARKALKKSDLLTDVFDRTLRVEWVTA